MKPNKILLVSVLSVAASVAQAQQGVVAGPVAGYVFDASAQALRPVQGIPGAALLGDPVALGMVASSATVSPRLDSVAVVAADGSFHIFTLNAGAAAEVPVNGITTTPARVVYSPNGTSAALFANGRIQVVTGLPAVPAPGSTFDLSAVPARPGRGHRQFTGSFAVSDDGAYVLVAEGSGVQLLGTGPAKQVMAGRTTSVAFAPGSHDAVVAGTGVTLVRDVAGAATPLTLAPADPTQTAVGAAFSSDGSHLYVAGTAAQAVTAYDLKAGTSSQIACNCSPAGLTGMGNLYRLNEVGNAPLWLLDPYAGTPRIVFVPVKTAAQ